MRTAIVADWLVTFGGAEHVLQELRALFPGAPIFTTVARRRGLGALRNADIRTTRLQRWYDMLGQHQVLLPWMPRAIEDIDLRGYDVVISSSHAVAKGIVPESRTLHVCYCHTPMRYAWEMEDQYLEDFQVPRLLRPLVRRKLRELRRWDLTTAKRVDTYIANSTTTQERIARIYNRESIVIPPPVDDRFFKVPPPAFRSTPYFLAVGRLVPYKRFDLLISVANVLKFPLWIAGTGQDESRLRRMAGPTVRFLGFVPEAELPGLYAGAEALLFPQEEDAGIVLLEALATGTPVVAYGAGGALDAITEGVNGEFFREQTTPAIQNAIEACRSKKWDRAKIRENARRFSSSVFRAHMRDAVEGAWNAFQKSRNRSTMTPA